VSKVPVSEYGLLKQETSSPMSDDELSVDLITGKPPVYDHMVVDAAPVVLDDGSVVPLGNERGSYGDKSKLRNFVFTLNNPTDSGEAFQAYVLSQLGFRYIGFQLEEGTQGTPHFQGYAELAKQTAFTKVRTVFRGAHLEARRGTPAQAAAYATKADTRVDGPWIHGELSKQGKRTDISVAVEAVQRDGILGAAREFPESYIKYRNGLSAYDAYLNRFTPRDPVTVRVFVGPAGCGKTRACWERAPELVSIPGDLSWFDNYMGDKSVLFDDFDGARSKTSLKFVLQSLDRYPLRLPVKGSFVAARYTEVYITSNFHPFDWYDWTDRPKQRRALQRRIHEIHLWTTEEGDEQLIVPGTPEWDTYWAGPRPTVRNVLGPLDDYVEQPQPQDYFNFM